MQEILRIFIKIKKIVKVDDVTLIYFDGKARGDFFYGKISHSGLDFQKMKDEKLFLSARYLLVGKDFTGKKCKIFIENSARQDDECTSPAIWTNSTALKKWENAKLCGKICSEKKMLIIKIFVKKE